MASLLYFLYHRIYLFLAFASKETFAEYDAQFSHMMLVFPENRSSKADNTRATYRAGATARIFGSKGRQLFFQSRATI
ncbi:hypothetical protein GFL62_11040 [Rhizobium leguminosarum bv. viciae]|nr:hypothetical protein [Rhizobium leguminosarum bv. viciae]